MKRTHARPLPSGKLSVTEATAVGSAMGVGGVGILYGLTNPVVAALVIIPSSHTHSLSHFLQMFVRILIVIITI